MGRIIKNILYNISMMIPLVATNDCLYIEQGQTLFAT